MRFCLCLVKSRSWKQESLTVIYRRNNSKDLISLTWQKIQRLLPWIWNWSRWNWKRKKLRKALIKAHRGRTKPLQSRSNPKQGRSSRKLKKWNSRWLLRRLIRKTFKKITTVLTARATVSMTIQKSPWRFCRYLRRLAFPTCRISRRKRNLKR